MSWQLKRCDLTTDIKHSLFGGRPLTSAQCPLGKDTHPNLFAGGDQNLTF